MVYRIGEPLGKLDEKDDAYLVQAKDVKGGYLPVDSVAARDALPDAIREEGLVVYVRSTKKEYRLEGGTSNAEWKEKVGGSGGGSTLLHELTDVDISPVAQQGAYQGRALLSRLTQGGDPSTEGLAAFEYVSVPDLQQFRYYVRRAFTENQGYGSSGTQYVAAEAALELTPTSPQPSVIYLNQDGIGNATRAANASTTNSLVPASAVMVMDVKRSSTDNTAPIKQKYTAEFHGLAPNGTAHTASVDIELFSLPSAVNQWQTVSVDVPSGFRSLWKVEISKAVGAVGQASKGLFVRYLTIESTTPNLGQLSYNETHALRHMLQWAESVFTVYDTFAGVNTQIADNDGRGFLITKDEFDNLVGITAADKAAAGEAGLFVADLANNRWRLAHGEADVANSLVISTRTNAVDFMDGNYTLRRIYPSALNDLTDFAADTAFPHAWDSLVYKPNADYTSGAWINRGNPVAGYFKATSFMFSNDDYLARVNVTAGTQAGAGVPAYVKANFSVKLDVSKDTKADIYFNSSQSTEDLAVPGDMYIGVIGKATADNTEIKYKVTVQATDTSGTAKTQTYELHSHANKRPRWFMQKLDDDIKSIDYVRFESVTGAADALSQGLHIECMAVVDPGMVDHLPFLGGVGATNTISELDDMDTESTRRPDEWSLLQFRPSPDYLTGGSWESVYNPITLLFKAGASLSAKTSFDAHVTITKGSQAGAGDSSYKNAGLDIDVSADSKVEVYFRNDKQYQDLALPGGMTFGVFAFSQTSAAFEFNVKIYGTDEDSGSAITEDVVLAGQGANDDKWFQIAIPDTLKSVQKVEFTDAGKNNSKAINIGSIAIIDPTALDGIFQTGESVKVIDPGTF